MIEWNEMSKATPKDGEPVLIMLKDASGCNATYKDGVFICSKNNERILPESVKFWKTRIGTETYEQQVKKKCGMCGRFR